MKYLIIGILILALLVGMCFFSQKQIIYRSREIAHPLELALSAIQAGDEVLAQAFIAEAMAAWEQSETLFTSLISHDHTNAIREDLAQLPWTYGHELGRAVEKVLQQLHGLEEMERVDWGNLL